MTVAEVLALLHAERDERGVGRDQALAQALWKTDVHDARVIALPIDDTGPR